MAVALVALVVGRVAVALVALAVGRAVLVVRAVGRMAVALVALAYELIGLVKLIGTGRTLTKCRLMKIKLRLE